MRFLIRTLLFWAITLPLFYFLGLPYLLGKLDKKMQSDSYIACMVHMQSEFHLNTPAAPMTQAEGKHYCHCVSDPLHIAREDLPELMQHKTPERLEAAQKLTLDTCNSELQAILSKAMDAAPAPRVERRADGSKVIHIQ